MSLEPNKAVVPQAEVEQIPTIDPKTEATAWDGCFGNLIPRFDTDRPDIAAGAAARVADAILIERRKRRLSDADLAAWDTYAANLGPKFDVNRPSVAAAATAGVADAMLAERRRRVTGGLRT